MHSGYCRKDISHVRQARDDKDARSLLGYLQRRDPFSSEDSSLRSIETGVTAGDAVNVEKEKAVGIKILESMEEVNVSDYTFKKASQVVTMDSKVNSQGEKGLHAADPQLLFQRLLTAAHASENTADVFKHELCNNPSSLFDASGMLQEADKSIFANAMWKAI